MKQNSWLNYINTFVFFLSIFLFIGFIALSAYHGLGFFALLLAVFTFWPASLIVAGIIVYGLIIIIFCNFVAVPQGKSGWSLFGAVALLLLMCLLCPVLIALVTR